MAKAAVIKLLFQILGCASCIFMAVVGVLGCYLGGLAFPALKDKTGALQLVLLGFYLLIFSVILGLCEAGFRALYKPFGFLGSL